MGDDSTAALGALRVDEEKLKGHVAEVVRSSVEETLNGLLDAEADAIWGRSSTNARPSGLTRGPDITSASSGRRPAR